MQVIERLEQPVEHRDGAPAQHPQRVHGQQQRADQQRAAPADEGVEGAAEVDAAVGRLERRDEHRRGARLGGQQRPAADQRRRRHRERDDHTDLPGAGADRGHQGVADRDPDRDPDRELDGAAAALAGRQPERDDGRDRREERLRVADHLGGDQPGERGRHGRVQDRPRVGDDPLSPGPQARARRLRCLLEQLVAPGAVDHLRYQRGDTFGGGRSAAFATSTVGSSTRR